MMASEVQGLRHVLGGSVYVVSASGGCRTGMLSLRVRSLGDDVTLMGASEM